MTTVLPTSLVGSYAQPNWLIDREKLAARFPPRVRARELWRVDPQWIDEAQDDATLLAIRDQERAGLDIVTDGEQRRESYSNRFANALTGIDLDNPGTALDRSGHPNPVPRVVGKVERKHPVQVGDLEFLKANTDRRTKMTVPGPFTMSQQAQNDHYESEAQLALDYAAAVNAEIRDLFAAGADIVQIDEPYMQARPEKAREYGREALAAALDGHAGTTAVHICFGYAAIIHERPEGYSFLTELAELGCDQISIETAQSNLDDSVLEGLPGKTIILGVLNLDDHAVETPETVADRIRRALPVQGRRGARGRAGLRDEVPAARLRVRQAAVAGGRRADRARRGLELRELPLRLGGGGEVALALVQRERAPQCGRRVARAAARPGARRRARAGHRHGRAAATSARRPPPRSRPRRARRPASPAWAAIRARTMWRLITHVTSHGAGMASIRSSTAAASAQRPWAMTVGARSTLTIAWYQRSPGPDTIASASRTARSAATASPASISASATSSARYAACRSSRRSAKPARACSISARASS